MNKLGIKEFADNPDTQAAVIELLAMGGRNDLLSRLNDGGNLTPAKLVIRYVKEHLQGMTAAHKVRKARIATEADEMRQVASELPLSDD